MCEVIEDEQAGKKFYSQTICNGPNCKTNEGEQIKTHNMGVNDVNSNMSDYFRSSINRAANKRTIQQIHNEFRDVFFSRIGCFEGMFISQVKDGSQPYQVPPRRVVYVL